MQNRRALIIGIDKYPNLRPEAQLAGCVRDARDVARLLETRFGFQARLLLDGQATQEGIWGALNELADQTRENDAVVVHYSGHGCQRPIPVDNKTRASNLEETFVPHDSSHSDLPNLDIPSAEIRAWIEKLTKKTPYLTLILDCCHSGTIATRTGTGKPRIRVRGLPPDLRQPAGSGRSRLRDTKGPASFIRHVVIAACKDEESAHELPFEDGNHGALTWNLIRELESLPEGACPTYLDVFEPVRSRVSSSPEFKQEPQLEGVRDRELFGLAELVPMSFLPVWERTADRVLLGGGATCGVTERSVWTIHPPSARQGGEPLGRVEVIEVRGMTASAGILDEIRPGAVDRWCRAVEEVSADGDGLDQRLRRYRNALGLRNDHSRLRGKVDFNLGILRNNRWERLDDGAEIWDSDQISFAVVNRHDESLHIYVLDFGLTGNIAQVYPVRGASDPLYPGREMEIGTLSDKLQLTVPDGAPDGGEELLKLFASTREIDLSPLFQTVRGTRDARAKIDSTRGGDDWITIERGFRLKRRPEGRRPGRVTRSGALATS